MKREITKLDSRRGTYAARIEFPGGSIDIDVSPHIENGKRRALIYMSARGGEFREVIVRTNAERCYTWEEKELR